MTETRPVNDPAAMADILASIRRIVSEDERRTALSPLRPAPDSEVLVLTRDMRVDAAAPAQPASETHAAMPPQAGTAAPSPSEQAVAPTPTLSAGDADLGELSVDEAVIIEISRAVVREELDGALGAELTRRIRDLVEVEVRRALAQRG